MKDDPNSVVHTTNTKNGSEDQIFLGGKCGQRLIPHIIDETARQTPDLECVSIPRSNSPCDGWKPISWSKIANAVNYAAHMIIIQAGQPVPGTFPTVAYIGLEDPRYLAFVIGAIKAGYKALLVSPRNSVEAQLNLFVQTECNLLFHEHQYAPMVQPWVNAKPGMKSVAVAPFNEWVTDGVTPIPYIKPFSEAEWDPLVVLHTSGSTGLPKAVVLRQGMVAMYDLHRYIPARNGSLTLLPTWNGFFNPRHLLIMPLFHAAGIIMSTVFAFYYNDPVLFRDPSRPITGDNILEWLRNSNPGWTIIPPAILDGMSRSQEAIDELKKLHVVGFGGGSIPPETPNRLAKHGIKLVHIIATTECAFFPYYSQPDASMWEWFIIPTDLMGIEWRPAGENVYEQVIKRKDNSKHRGLQSCFYTFPELDEFSTKDLYQPHPALKDHWKYMGRADDIIVFSTGEKLNPVTIEMAVMGHPEVIGAQVVGSKQFHAALIVEPAQHPKSEEEKKVLLDDVWPTIEAVNSETVAHGRVPRDYVFLTDPKRPFPRAGKGTIQRAMAAKLYAHDIKSFFEQRKDEMAISMDLDVTSQPAFARSLQQLVQSVFKGDELGANDDFFTAGMDSLQAIQLSRTLRASFETAGIELGEKEIDSRTIYNYPSVTKLANHTLTLAHANLGEIKPGQNPSSDITVDEKVMFDALVKKYIRDLPAATPNKPVAAQKGQVIIITGTTGALGSYLLDLALKCPHVGKVICFNRGADSRERQIKITSARGLSTDFSRAEFLQADLAEPDLGLAPEVKHRLSDEIDRVIHNAWPVNFNMSVGSFELQIRGVRHLVDFSAKVAKKAVPITFISTAGTVERWPTPEVPVPEKSLPDWSLAMLGYGQSKLASSMILDQATRESGVPSVIVRVGQIAGPRAKKGQWNPQEWLPSLVRSSLYLGLLPDSLGSFENVGWAPVEDIANMVLDISGVTFPRPAEEVNGYFHALNPKPTDWSSLIPTLRDFYGERIQKVVSLEEWICALEQSQVDSLSIDINPAVKLLDTYRLAAEGVKIGTKGISMSTTRTELYSLAIRQAEAVSPALMRHWCEQWQF